MAEHPQNMTPEDAVSKYSLSKRGAENLVHGDHWAPIEKALENAWDKDKNPNGVHVNFFIRKELERGNNNVVLQNQPRNRRKLPDA
jgi:hypothetical protein